MNTSTSLGLLLDLDYKAQLSTTFDGVLEDLKSDSLVGLIEGLAKSSKKTICNIVKLINNGETESLRCSDFCTEYVTTPHGTQVSNWHFQIRCLLIYIFMCYRYALCFSTVFCDR